MVLLFWVADSDSGFVLDRFAKVHKTDDKCILEVPAFLCDATPIDRILWDVVRLVMVKYSIKNWHTAIENTVLRNGLAFYSQQFDQGIDAELRGVHMPMTPTNGMERLLVLRNAHALCIPMYPTLWWNTPLALRGIIKGLFGDTLCLSDDTSLSDMEIWYDASVHKNVDIVLGLMLHQELPDGVDADVCHAMLGHDPQQTKKFMQKATEWLRPKGWRFAILNRQNGSMYCWSSLSPDTTLRDANWVQWPLKDSKRQVCDPDATIIHYMDSNTPNAINTLDPLANGVFVLRSMLQTC